MLQNQSEIGVVGLGVMGRSLLLNISDHGFSAAGYDKDIEKVKTLLSEAGSCPVQGAESAASFAALLRQPRLIILLVPAGKIVDAVIDSLQPFLEDGDLIIDSGNSHFSDTDRRQKELEVKGLHFFGMGISGGESGARRGPSMMPGGPQQAYERARPILEAVAARVNGDPCVTYLGPRSAGHYVKMVHNGIEYGLMQLIAETYDLLKSGFGLTNDALSELFSAWNDAELNSYLMEITAAIFRKVDDKTGGRLIDQILDSARQKGTGQWASQSALDLHVPTPTIDAAVAMRNLSGLQTLRAAAAAKLGSPRRIFPGESAVSIQHIRRALFAAAILCYAQGMAQLRAASQSYEYNLDLAAVARIWRGGCIIRSALLEPIHTAFESQPRLPHLLLDEYLGSTVSERETDLRFVVQTAAELDIPAPAFMASLSYYEGLRAASLPANLIQAQRDYFGAHTYERTDSQGAFHTQWEEEQP